MRTNGAECDNYIDAELEEIRESLTPDRQAEALAKRRAELNAEPLRVLAKNLSFDGLESIIDGLRAHKAEHIQTTIGDGGIIKKIGIKGWQLVKPKRGKKLSKPSPL